MAGVKIVDLPALGRDLINTDLLEVSLNGGGSRKITGQEIMNASKLAIGSTPIVAGTVGRLLFQDTGDVLSQSGNLFWDNTNARLGIGTSSPAVALSVFGTIRAYNPTTSTAYPQIYTSPSNFPVVEGYGNGLTLQTVNSYSTSNGAIRIYPQANSVLILGAPSSNNNVLIGTFTDAGYKLDVNGNTRISGDVTAVRVVSSILRDGNNNTYINNSLINVASTNLAIGGTTVQDFTFTTKTSGGKYVFNNANVLINTTTDDGFKLDVNGTARVQGATTISSGTNNNIRLSGTSIEFSRTVDGAYNTYITKNGSTNSVGLTFAALNSGNFFFESTSRILSLFGSTLNVGINTTTDAGYRLDVNGTARVSGQLVLTQAVNAINVGTGTNYSQNEILCGVNNFVIRTNVQNRTVSLQSGNTTLLTANFWSGGNIAGVAISDDGAPTVISSAVLNLVSTTRGFLPPRMTNAQRAAIASPAVGLIVYCTDATEGLYVYKSTGWTFMV